MDPRLLVLFFSLACVLIAVWVELGSPNARRKARGLKMLKRAKKIEQPSIVYNIVNGVTAVCRYDDFEREKSAWSAKVASECDPKKKEEWMVHKMSLKVPFTFTFSTEQENVPAHTGTDKDLEDIGRRLVFFVTHLHRSEVPEHVFKEAMKFLVVKDSRLFVPFSSKDMLQEQLKMWGDYTPEHAHKVLVYNDKYNDKQISV